ncbi:MAG: hypothetical protein U1A27_11135 [Phycisphaerae bacterium]
MNTNQPVHMLDVTLAMIAAFVCAAAAAYADRQRLMDLATDLAAPGRHPQAADNRGEARDGRVRLPARPVEPRRDAADPSGADGARVRTDPNRRPSDRRPETRIEARFVAGVSGWRASGYRIARPSRDALQRSESNWQYVDPAACAGVTTYSACRALRNRRRRLAARSAGAGLFALGLVLIMLTTVNPGLFANAGRIVAWIVGAAAICFSRLHPLLHSLALSKRVRLIQARIRRMHHTLVRRGRRDRTRRRPDAAATAVVPRPRGVDARTG